MRKKLVEVTAQVLAHLRMNPLGITDLSRLVYDKDDAWCIGHVTRIIEELVKENAVVPMVTKNGLTFRLNFVSEENK
jgi:hypothetical protein